MTFEEKDVRRRAWWFEFQFIEPMRFSGWQDKAEYIPPSSPQNRWEVYLEFRDPVGFDLASWAYNVWLAEARRNNIAEVEDHLRLSIARQAADTTRAVCEAEDPFRGGPTHLDSVMARYLGWWR